MRESVDSHVPHGSSMLPPGDGPAVARNRQGLPVNRLKLHEFVNLVDRDACNEKSHWTYLWVCTGSLAATAA